MRNYPYLYLFSMNAYYTECIEIKEEIVKSFDQMSQQSLTLVLEKIDNVRFRNDLKLEDVYHEILLASDGFMLKHYRSNEMNIDEIEKQYANLIAFWKKAY